MNNNIQVLYVGNDTLLDVEALRNELTGAFINDATVEVTLHDLNGLAVTGDTWPKAMPYVDGSDGAYRATMVYTLGLIDGQRYRALITADAGAGLRAAWQVECVARARA